MEWDLHRHLAASALLAFSQTSYCWEVIEDLRHPTYYSRQIWSFTSFSDCFAFSVCLSQAIQAHSTPWSHHRITLPFTWQPNVSNLLFCFPHLQAFYIPFLSALKLRSLHFSASSAVSSLVKGPIPICTKHNPGAQGEWWPRSTWEFRIWRFSARV